jgi:hypothetical protein
MTEYYETHDGEPPKAVEKDADPGGLRWVGKVGVVVIAVFIGVILLADHHSQQGSDAAAVADVGGPVSDARHFTKAEFDREVRGKTKEQIRDEFGSPGTVHDDSDEWVYYDVPVYDASAGTKVAFSSIRFEGIDGADDRAVDVSFQ